MLSTLIIIVAVILLGGLLYFEQREQIRGKLLTKIPLSLLFVAAALVQPPPMNPYDYVLLIGLICCLGGDVFLALPSDRMFLFGLVSFLLGHVFYLLAFMYLTGITGWFSIGTPIILVVSGMIFLYLRSHLGAMTRPVLAYIVVISFMLAGAWAVFGRVDLPRRGTFMIFCGALLFYLSDFFVARDRFIKNEFLNRRFGLPMYYAGQFLLAFSIGQV